MQLFHLRIIAMANPTNGPKYCVCRANIKPPASPANTPMIPIASDMYPIEGTPVPKP